MRIDVVAYSDVLADRDYIVKNLSRTYQNRYRLGGAKLTIDGSPQGFTAWRDRPYYDPVGDYPPGYVGYPAVTREQVLAAVDWAYANDVQLLTHSNGEAASDLLTAAHTVAREAQGGEGRRDVLIHGQFLREDQVAAFDRIGISPSLFPMHTFCWATGTAADASGARHAPARSDLAAAIRARIAPLGGQDLTLPAREPIRDPPGFD